ncbi:MAG: hemolysin family protein [Synechocystis sp.]|nr:hemolysin family protein [Synechocystis sp.]
MLEMLAAVLIVLLGSGICSCSETALFSVPLVKVRQLSQSNNPSALALYAIRQKMNRPIGTIVVLNNIFNIVGSITIGSLAAKNLQDAWMGIFSGVLTLLIIIFGEIIPKTIGERYATSIALLIAIPVRFLTVLFTPLVWLIEQITNPFTRGKRMPSTNEAEIKFLAALGHKEGVIEGDEEQMIQRVFQLNDLMAMDLMTPRVIITYLLGESTLIECQQDIIQSQHTRILVVDDYIDEVLGIALKQDLLAALIQGQGHKTMAELARPARFVHEGMRADKLLKEFQEKREHLMVVIDEYGGVAGVITLEDVIEVLTGEIVDETDKNIDLREIARKKRELTLQRLGSFAAVPIDQQTNGK